MFTIDLRLVEKLHYMYCEYGEPDTDPYRFSRLGFEGIFLVPEDIPETFEDQKNGKS